MTYQIIKRFDFSASHQLRGLRDGHPCGRLHGHNYSVEVVLGSNELDKHGFVLDYGELYPLKDFIDEKFDHRHLNDLFSGINPTAENLAEVLFEFCFNLWGDKIVEVRVSETPKTWAIYSRPKGDL